MNPRFSVIIVTYNSAPYLPTVIGALRAQTGRNWEAIVIDQASRDNTVEVLRRVIDADTRFQITEHSTNTGFCAAINEGINRARGDAILFLNPDAVLDRSYLELALATLAREPRVAAVQGRIRKYDFSRDEGERKTNLIDTTGHVMLKSRRTINRGQGEMDHGQYNTPGEVFGVDGAVPFWRTAALEDVKLCVDGRCEYLDEDFFMYKDDVDLSWRARLAGWSVAYNPQCLAWHQRGSGQSAARSIGGILAERRAIGTLAKYHSWKNARLLQIKNDLVIHLLRDLPWWLAKEVASWLYVLVAEPTTVPAIGETLRLLPRAFAKRRRVMAKRRVSAAEIGRWFE